MSNRPNDDALSSTARRQPSGSSRSATITALSTPWLDQRGGRLQRHPRPSAHRHVNAPTGQRHRDRLAYAPTAARDEGGLVVEQQIHRSPQFTRRCPCLRGGLFHRPFLGHSHRRRRRSERPVERPHRREVPILGAGGVPVPRRRVRRDVVAGGGRRAPAGCVGSDRPHKLCSAHRRTKLAVVGAGLRLTRGSSSLASCSG